MKQEISRKLIHLSSLIYPCLYYFLSKKEMLLILFWIFFILCFVDILRSQNSKFKALCNKFFGAFLREEEKIRGAYGSTYFIFGILLSVLLFEKQIAIASMLVLIISDAGASILGKLIKGRKIFGEKTLAGFTAFFILTFIILVNFNEIWGEGFILTAFVSFVCATFELYSKKIRIDDNAVIPVVCGAMCVFASFLHNFIKTFI